MARRRWLAVTAGVLGGVLGLTLLGIGGTALWLRTNAGSDWLKRKIESALATSETEVSIGAIHTDLWTGARIEEFHLKTSTMTIHVGQLDADIDRSALFGGKLKFDRAVAESVLVDLSASEPTDEPSAPFSGLGIDLDIDGIDLRGAQVIYRNAAHTEIVRVVGGSGTAHFIAKGAELRVEELDVTALVGLKGAVAAHVKGEVVIDAAGTHLNGLDVRLPRSELDVDGSIEDVLALDIAVDHVAASDLDALLGRPGLAGELTGGVKVTGPTDHIGWSADLQGIGTTQGEVKGSGTVDLSTETLGWTVDANLDGIDVNQLYPGTGNAIVLTGHTLVDGKGTDLRSDLVVDLTWDGTSHDGFGQHIDKADAKIRIEDGAVILQQTTLDGIIGELSLSGRIELVDGPMDLHATGWIRPSRLREMGVTGVDSSGWLDARITGDLTDEKLPIHVVGTVRFTPFRSGSDITFDSVRAQFDATAQGEVVDGTASVQAAGGMVVGTAIAEADAELVRFHTGPDGLKVSGDLQALAVAMPDVFSTVSATGVWGLTKAGATARVDLGSLELVGMHGTDGVITVDQRGDDVGITVQLNQSDRALFHTQGNFDLAHSAIALDTLMVAPTPRAEWVSTRPVGFRLSDGGLADADIGIRSELGSLELTGTLGTKGPLDAKIRVRDLNLEGLTDFEPEKLAGLTGTLDLDLDLAGQAAHPEIEGTVDARRVTFPDAVNALDVSGTVGATDRALTMALELGVAGAPVAHVRGSLPVLLDLADPKFDPKGTVDLTAALTPGGLDRIATLAPAAEGLPKGRASGVLEVTGIFDNPDLRIAGISELDVPGWLEPQRTEFEFTRTLGALSGWADARQGAQLLAQMFGLAQTDLHSAIGPVLATGALPEDFDWTRLASDLYLTGVILEVPIETVASMAGRSDLPLSGHITGGFQVTGTPDKPALDGTINWVDGRIGRQPVTGMDLIIGHTETGYDLDLNLEFPDDVGLKAKGTIPVVVDLRQESKDWANGDLDLTVNGQVPMRAITAFTRSVGKSSGLVALDGTVGGTFAEPDPQVSLSMVDGEVTANDLGLRIENIALSAHASRDRIVLTEFSGTTRPDKQRLDLQEAINSAEKAITELDPNDSPARQSSFKVVGQVELVGNTLGEVSMGARLENGTWLVSTADTAVRAEGTIRVGGTYPALVAGGDLTLRQGLVKLDAAVFIDRAPLQPDPRITIARANRAEIEAPSGPPWYQEMTASIDLDLRRAMELEVSMPFVDDLGSIGAFVSRADLQARIGGRSKLTLADGEPSMVGELDIVDGRLKMLGRRFDVESGVITFGGGDIAEPMLAITAKTTVATIPIKAEVKGTPSAPTITPTCEGYPNESDCLTILVTGRAPDEEGSGNTAAVLAGMALGGLLGEQNVADISIEPGGALQIGAAATNSIYLTYTLDSKPELNENQNTLEADLGLARRVVLNVAAGDQKSWMDLFWEIRF